MSPLGSLTLAQMRHQSRRLVAAALAVLLGACFATASLLAGTLLKRTFERAVAVDYPGVQVVVQAGGAPRDVLDDIRALPQVAVAESRDSLYAQITASGRDDHPSIAALPASPALRSQRLREGRLPSSPGEIALAPDVMARLRLALGERAELVLHPAAPPTGDADREARPAPVRRPLTVVGTLDVSSALGTAPGGVAPSQDVLDWMRQEGADDTVGILVVRGVPGTAPAQLRDAVARVPSLRGAPVLTLDEHVRREILDASRGVDLLGGILLGFAAIALFVAGMVITNTFQVLVVHRTRTLALLRCVGATRAQLRGSVLREAVLLGLLASAAGVLAGIGLLNGVAGVLSRSDLGLPIPGSVTPTVLSLLVPVALGTGVTVLAALAPARAATRVPPIAALRVSLPAPGARRIRWGRLVLTVPLVTAGAGLMALGAIMTSRGGEAEGLLPALAGGMVSFVGILVGAPLVVPSVVGLGGRIAGLAGGVATRTATANATRNPRRTATTSAALLIGVTLVTTLVTGAEISRVSLTQMLDETFPVDLSVTAADLAEGRDGSSAGIAPEAVRAVEGTAGIVGTSEVRGVPASVAGRRQPLLGVDVAQVRRVARNAAAVDGLAPGTVRLDSSTALELGVRAGQRVTVTVGARGLELTAVVGEVALGGLTVTLADLERVTDSAPVLLLLLRTRSDTDAATVVTAVEDAVSAVSGETAVPRVEGIVAERAVYDRALDTVLLILLGLIAVAVVIALIGVANTLSLSVVERTRESATLRALGLTRRQLRASLAVEGVLIAGAGTLLGIALGVLYGWVGSASLLGGEFSPQLAVPRGQLLVVLVGGLLAGALASALPARRAAGVAPVAALAEV